MNACNIFTKASHLLLWIYIVSVCASYSHGAAQAISPRVSRTSRLSPGRTAYNRRYYRRTLSDRPTYTMLRARSSNNTPSSLTSRTESTGRRSGTFLRRVRIPTSGKTPYTGRKYIITPARRLPPRYRRRDGTGRRVILPTRRRYIPRVRTSSTTKATTTRVKTTTKPATMQPRRIPIIRKPPKTTPVTTSIRPTPTEITTTTSTLVTTSRRQQASTLPLSTVEPRTRASTSSTQSSTTTTQPSSTAPSTTTTTTTRTTTTTAATTTTEPSPVTLAEITEQDNSKSSTALATTAAATTTPIQTRRRTLPRRPIFAPRRTHKPTQHRDPSKNLDYSSSYYHALVQVERRLGEMIEKQIQRSREDYRNVWKGILSVKSDVRKTDHSFNVMKRNMTHISGRVHTQNKELDKLKEAHKWKIDQIETHQGTQDRQYLNVYHASKNNSKQIEGLADKMSSLLPIVAEIASKVDESNEMERNELDMLKTHMSESFEMMSNQIRVQQSTVTNLGNQVRTELDLLHAVKQSMSRRMEQNYRKLSEDVNSHLSTHTTQITRVETSVTRQAERIKHLTAIVRRHNDLLNSDDLFDASLMKHVDNITNYLGMMYTNLSRVSESYDVMRTKVASMEKKLSMMGTAAHRMTEAFENNTQVTARLQNSYTATAQELQRLSDLLNFLTERYDEESGTLRSDLDKALETQKMHERNISALMNTAPQEDSQSRREFSHFLADEPVSNTPLQVTQTFRRLLIELGVEDRITRLTRVMRLQQHRMANVTKAVIKIAEDKEAITDTTTHYLSIIKSQADLIKDQNKTITKLELMVNEQEQTIGMMQDDLMNGEDSVRKLTNIIANIAVNAKSPMASQRDCHDVWLNGHRESGVYNIIENMKLRPVQCNLTDYGGWTVIQKRRDGSQDFDQTFEDYRQGFGDVYGEYWLGLDGIKTITRKVRTNVALRIILEDWNGDTRTVTYSRFYLYGKGYSISISGYDGDAGDSLSSANGLPFSAKLNDDDYGNACNSRRHAGWWFSSPANDCGACNLNGEYNRFSDIKSPGTSAIYWKSWHGSGYPLKGVSMQIIPTEVLDDLNQLTSTTSQYDGTLDEIGPGLDGDGPVRLAAGESYRDASDSEAPYSDLDYDGDYNGFYMSDG